MEFILEILKDNIPVCLIILSTALYLFITKNDNYWASRNVKYIRPKPLFGNSFKTFFSLAPANKLQQETYNYFAGLPYCGTWTFHRPKLMIRDPHLIEQIMIKDFSYFTDRDSFNPRKSDPLGNHLVNLNGNRWRVLRTKLTPVFTSGKLKSMLQQVDECAETLIKHIEEESSKGGPLEVRNEMAGFTLDVIGSCAFGINIKAIRNPDSEFRRIGKSIFAPSRMGKIQIALRAQFSTIMRLIGWNRMSNQLRDFFINTVKGTVKYREENSITRNDFIQLMMEIRKDEEKQVKEGNLSTDEIIMDDNTMTANAFVFFLAGYETTASTLGYILFELSQHKDIQEKAYNEIVQVLKKHNGEVNWESLKEMTFVEQIMLETLRKYPPAISVGRKVVKPYKVPNSDLELAEGIGITIPVYSLHHDPKYYPEPEKFDPDRFSEANKHKIQKSTYLPFGDGPRICIGLRFAKVEIKAALSKLITNFKFSLDPKTSSPLKFSEKTILLVPTDGIWINFTPRLNKDCKVENTVLVS